MMGPADFAAVARGRRLIRQGFDSGKVFLALLAVDGRQDGIEQRLQQPLDPLAGFGRLVTGGLGQIGENLPKAGRAGDFARPGIAFLVARRELDAGILDFHDALLAVVG
jgi:hypothetical protein